MKRGIISSSELDKFSLYVDGERNYEDVHYFVVKDMNNSKFLMRDAINLSDYLGRRIEYISDYELWVDASKSEKSQICRMLENLA